MKAEGQIACAWSSRSSRTKTSVKPAGPLRGSPTVAFGAIYVMTQNNQVLALRPDDGSLMWADIMARVCGREFASEPASLDPHVQWNPDSYYVYRNIFDNLVTRNPKGEVVPQIGKSWKYLNDNEIEFEIVDGAKFHDGTPLTAQDLTTLLGDSLYGINAKPIAGSITRGLGDIELSAKEPKDNEIEAAVTSLLTAIVDSIESSDQKPVIRQSSFGKRAMKLSLSAVGNRGRKCCG